MSKWLVRWMAGGRTRSEACDSYEAALTLKDSLESGGAAFVTIEEDSDE
jgi:hypothetical protein